jgi:hypothetical protein
MIPVVRRQHQANVLYSDLSDASDLDTHNLCLHKFAPFDSLMLTLASFTVT